MILQGTVCQWLHWMSELVPGVEKLQTVRLTATRVIMNLSIITANLPALKNHLYNLRTGRDLFVGEEPPPSDLAAYFTSVQSEQRKKRNSRLSQTFRPGTADVSDEREPEDGIVRTVEIFVSSRDRQRQ